LILTPLSFLRRNTVYAADQRFGIGGSCSIATGLDIPFVYNWGHGSRYANQNEYDCWIKGRNVFFSVGKLDNTGTYTGNPDYNIPRLEQQYLLDTDDKNLYARLNTILNLYDAKNRANPQSSFLLIPKYAKDFPGMYYAVANEPDWWPYIAPQNYAELYNIFYTRIKKYDPTAKVMTGGILSDTYSWVDAFRNSYRSQFGAYPPVDVWNIHPYVSKNDWQAAKKIIVDFRDIFLTRIGEKDKPVWISEFGMILPEGTLGRGSKCAWHGCQTPDQQYTEWRRVSEEFMIPLIGWLKSTDYAQKWFWYYGGEDYNWSFKPPGLNFIGDIYKESTSSARYNPIGIAYSDLASDRMLFNGGFEAAGPQPFKWQFAAGGSGTDYTATFDESVKHLGTRAMKIHFGQQTGSSVYIGSLSQDVTHVNVSGKTVRFTGWTKTDAVGKANLKINLYYANGTSDTNWTPSVTSQASYADWTNISTPLVTIPANVVKIAPTAVATGQGATVWFDDFSIETDSPPPTPSPTRFVTPTPTPTPIPCAKSYEAEDVSKVILAGGANIGSCNNCSGGKSVNGVYGTPGNSITMKYINVGGTGDYTMVMTTACDRDRTYMMSVNGNPVTPITIKKSGGWYTYAGATSITVNLSNKTNNTIKLYSSEAPGIYLDKISFPDGCATPSGTVSPTPANSVTPTSTPISKQGDANGDRKVDEADYSIWLANFKKTFTGETKDGDFNGDMTVDEVDYTIWLAHYGT
jgi:hypothetical protein